MTDPNPEISPQETHHLVLEADRIMGLLRAARDEIGQVIFGQEQVIDNLLIAVLSGGHAILFGAPGLGKTLLVSTAAQTLGLATKRVQFTPDLMPSDITGGEILDTDASGRRAFRFVEGPVFTQMLLADEINRASPRTQSALLQAMQEYNVTQSGVEYALPKPFHVLATQNPFEQEGTYPLPEAQLDRFMLCIPLTYPHPEAEKQMLIATTGAVNVQVRQIFTTDTLLAAQDMVRRLPIGEDLVELIVKLVGHLRPESSSMQEAKHLSFGPGPRAAQSLMLTCRARALLTGRLAPDITDIEALADVTLSHRMSLKYSAEAENVTIPKLIAAALRRLS